MRHEREDLPTQDACQSDATIAVTEGEELSRGGRRGERRRSTWKVVLGSFAVVALLLLGGTAVGGWWLTHSLTSKVESIKDPFKALPTRAPTQAVTAEEQPAVNILVLGSDSRISAGDPSQWQAGAQRTDAMMVVQVSGDRKNVTVMSIPRDSWVDIPGHGTAKINAAYSYGGPTLAIQTVEQLTSIHIDHFVIADFESFATMTDHLGGVTINLNHDQTLAGTEFTEGAQRLNGKQALAYVRERYSLPNGDFDRVKRQQAWMRAIVQQVFANKVLSDPTKLYSFMKVAAASVSADESFSLDEMVALAQSVRNVGGSGITFFTAPTSGTGTSDDGQSIVLLDPDADQPLFAAYADGSIGQYLTEHPDAVERLPMSVN